MILMNEVSRKASLAKSASIQLNNLPSAKKDKLILAMAAALLQSQALILKANALDLDQAEKKGISAALLDRLTLNTKRIQNMADGLKAVAKLADPVGKILWKTRRPNGLLIKKVSVPFGVIGMIYESRPNVTADAAGLCIKAGSAVVLRGGTAAGNTNKAIVQVLKAALKNTGINPDAIQLIESPDRTLVKELLTCNAYLDLIIPRGGADLIQKVVTEATVPAIETGIGNCHVYVDKTADLNKALRIAFNSKVQRPSVCNAMETLLIHKEIASAFLPKIIGLYLESGVVIHGCPKTRKYNKQILSAKDADYYKEYLGLEIAVKVVDNLDQAITHINKYGSKHTESIVAKDKSALKKFSEKIDAAAVIFNASTRFTDGGEFGFGCEIGISTQKLHARGPMGLAEITTYKYLVEGNGQIRN